MSQELCGLLRQAQSDPSSSQLAALLQQHSHLKQSTDTVFAPALSACNDQLEMFEVCTHTQTIAYFCLVLAQIFAFSVMHYTNNLK